MAVSLKHTKVVAAADDGTSEVGSNEWNEEHVLQLATAKLLGRAAAGTGAAEEIALGAGLVFVSGALTVYDPSVVAYEKWDFINHGITTSTATGTSFVKTGSVPVAHIGPAPGTAVILAPEAAAPGISRLGTGTVATGYSRLYFTPGPSLLLGSGAIRYGARIRIPTLSSAAERFSASINLTSVITGANQSIIASYADDVNTGQWQLVATDGGGTTTTNSTTAPVANTWYLVEIEVNAAATSAELFINNSSVGTVAANIPTIGLALAVHITKSVGTTARNLDVDFAEIQQTFTTAR